MDYDRRNNGLLTFLEHWWLILSAIVVLLTLQVLNFFMKLTGESWLWCYATALCVAGLGVALIFHSKLPLYRQRRFLTFSSRAVPENRRPYYRWGYLCVILATALFLGLFLARP